MKEAEALASAGYDVTILGVFSDSELKRRDLMLIDKAGYRFIPVLDWTMGKFARSIPLSVSRAGKLIHRLFKIENFWELGGVYPFLKSAAMRTEADLYICHMEQAMAVGRTLLHKGKRVAIDMEDWYSEDLPLQERRARPCELLRRLERLLLTNGEFGFCTSHSMASSLVATYGCPRPNVVYNTFPWADRDALDHQWKDRPSGARPSLYWFSQTIGPARGLEDLISALPSLAVDMEVHLRGTPSPGYREWLEANTPVEWKGRIFLHDMVHNTEILSRIAEHDIGFAGEHPDCRSRNVTVSNKLFHYMLGGLAVVASNTSGQHEIAAGTDGGVRLYHAGDPRSLADEINQLLVSPDALKAAKVASLRAAELRYNWEIEKAHLLEYVAKSLGSHQPDHVVTDR